MQPFATAPIEPQRRRGVIATTDGRLTFRHRFDHFLARIGYRRSGHRVAPGLYALGDPGADSPLLCTANYTLSFDALRSAMTGWDVWILALDTEGVNVWCAAGKGTFGTDELVYRLTEAGLKEKLNHRHVITPQLGAPGVAAHKVKKATGFKVLYGPIRADDLPDYLATGEMTDEMRRVRFPLWDRMVLAPMEFKHAFWPLLLVASLLWLGDGPRSALAAFMAVFSGSLLFGLWLPHLPSPNYSFKGFVLGWITAAPFVMDAAINGQTLHAFAYLLFLPPVTAFLGLNFTGSTPYPSPTGVKREIFHYARPMALSFALGTLLLVGAIVQHHV